MLYLKITFLIFGLIFQTGTLVSCWDLTSYGINANYFVSDIAIFFNRAFLAIPRQKCVNNVSEPTLIEVPWIEVGHLHPLGNNRITLQQTWTDCNELQTAISLALEPRKAKLWILDQGNEFCPPKLMFYSLILNSFGEGALEIKGVVRERLSSMVIEDDFVNSRAFISNVGSNSILMVHLDTLDWKILRLSEKKHHRPMEINSLALSKTEPVLYLTGKESTKLYELNLKNLDNNNLFDTNETMVAEVTLLGHKLGKSSGLETDHKNGLIYYLTKDYAVVRWIVGAPMTAETHNVLAQSYHRLPYVSKIFTGPHGGIWALVNPQNPQKCLKKNVVIDAKKGHNSIVQERTEKFDENEEILETRVVRVMKFSRFFDEKFANFNDLGRE